MQETSGQKTEIFCKELAKKTPLVSYNFSPLSFCLSVSHIAVFSPSAADFNPLSPRVRPVTVPAVFTAPERVYLVGEMLIHFSPATFIRTI